MLGRGGGRGARVEATRTDRSTLTLNRRRCRVLSIVRVPLGCPHGPSLFGFEAQFHGDQCTEFQKPWNQVSKVGGPVILPSQKGVVLLRARRQPRANPTSILPASHCVGVTGGEGSNNWLPGRLTGAWRRHAYRASGIEVTGTTWCG